MARAAIRTLLPLDRFANILGINPLHFNQVTDAAMPNTTCAQVFKQEGWQESGAISREDIAQAIQEAEQRIAAYLGFSLLPWWVVDERMPTPQPAFPELLNGSGRDVQGFRQSVQLSQGQYISGGIEAKTLIAAASTITFTDEDSDGYFETATVTAATTVTEVAEIACYYPVAAMDGAGQPVWLPGGAANGAWEIRPLRSVVISGGVVTVKMWRHQLVIPLILEALSPGPADGQDDDDFLPSVDIYRHWNSPEQQAQLMWSPLPYWWGYGPSGGCGCSESDCVQCTAAVQDGCLLGSNYQTGRVQYTPATWDATTGAFTSSEICVGRAPDRLRLWYYAGLQDKGQRCPTLQMDPGWERAVAYYAITFLDRPICGCSNIDGIVQHWRTEKDLNDSSGTGSTSYQLGKNVLDNPFGQTRGALFAWNKCNTGEGAKLGRAAKL